MPFDAAANALVDELLAKDCFVVDYLPKTVPKNCNGHFFDVEYYLLNSPQCSILKDRFSGVIFRLMCYYHTSILWNGWIEHPKPEQAAQAIAEIMDNHSGTLNCLFPEKNALLVFDWDCLNLSIYNPDAEMQQLLGQIAAAEGLFFRPAAV